MKTPRELLLQKHYEANRKLDALRQQAVSQMPEASCDSPVEGFRRAIRWHLGFLGAAWMLIVFFQIQEPKTSTDYADAQPGPALSVVQQNRALIRELLNSESVEKLAAGPEKRSQVDHGWIQS